MRALSVLIIALSATTSAAQESSSLDSIDPNSVPLSTRQTWCVQNQAQCPLICLQQPGIDSETTQSNTCNAKTLSYSCVCSNGISPNITQYSQTLPFYVCQEGGNQCVARCNGDNACSNDFRSQHPCGAQDPYKGNNAPLSTSDTASAMTSRPPTSGFAGQGNSANKHNGASTMLSVLCSLLLPLAVLL